MEKMYAPRIVAKILAVDEQTVRVWLRSGALKGVKVGNMWRISESNVEKFLSKGGK